MIRHVIDSHTQPVPSVLEIPSKDHPYDASKDSILRRAKVNCEYIYIYLFFKQSQLKNIIHILIYRACSIQKIYIDIHNIVHLK